MAMSRTENEFWKMKTASEFVVESLVRAGVRDLLGIRESFNERGFKRGVRWLIALVVYIY